MLPWGYFVGKAAECCERRKLLLGRFLVRGFVAKAGKDDGGHGGRVRGQESEVRRYSMGVGLAFDKGHGKRVCFRLEGPTL